MEDTSVTFAPASASDAASRSVFGMKLTSPEVSVEVDDTADVGRANGSTRSDDSATEIAGLRGRVPLEVSLQESVELELELELEQEQEQEQEFALAREWGERSEEQPEGRPEQERPPEQQDAQELVSVSTSAESAEPPEVTNTTAAGSAAALPAIRNPRLTALAAPAPGTGSATGQCAGLDSPATSKIRLVAREEVRRALQVVPETAHMPCERNSTDHIGRGKAATASGNNSIIIDSTHSPLSDSFPSAEKRSVFSNMTNAESELAVSGVPSVTARADANIDADPDVDAENTRPLTQSELITLKVSHALAEARVVASTYRSTSSRASAPGSRFPDHQRRFLDAEMKRVSNIMLGRDSKEGSAGSF